MAEPDDRNTYVVAYRAHSAAIFLPRGQLRIRVPYQDDEMRLTFRTRYIEEGLERPVPGNLWVDARGEASSLEAAVRDFGNAGGTILPVISLVTNSAIDNLQPEIAYDTTGKKPEHEYLQSFLPPEGSRLHLARRIPIEAVTAVMSGIEGHQEVKRIRRATAYYGLALAQWRLGFESLAIAFLYMGIETLTKAAIRHTLKSTGDTEENLARSLGVDPTDLRQCRSLSSELDAAFRRKRIFEGDATSYKVAKEASDGLEHGYLPFDEIREKALNVRDVTAGYLRNAILDLLPLPREIVAELKSTPYVEPLGNSPVAKYLKGALVGDVTNLAAPGNEYPVMIWRSEPKSIEYKDEGNISLRFDEKFTAQLGENVEFRAVSFEVWRQ